MDIKSQDNSYVSSKPTEVVFEDKAVTPQKVVVAEKKELSENIKAFDERVRKVYTETLTTTIRLVLKKNKRFYHRLNKWLRTRLITRWVRCWD
jgi:hypothetical protein